jgi:hypothetical protein
MLPTDQYEIWLLVRAAAVLIVSKSRVIVSFFHLVGTSWCTTFSQLCTVYALR